MGQKVSPHGLRVGVIKDWYSKWYADKNKFADYLVEDNKVREFVKNASKVAQKIDIMFEKAAYDNKTVAVHFSVGEKESAIISHMQLNPVNITVNDNIITFEEGTAEHYIDISQFDSVKCDDECVNDIADATIDMMCDHWSVHFDILTI